MPSERLTRSSDASLAEILSEVVPASLYLHVLDRLTPGGPWAPQDVPAKPRDLAGQDPEDLDQVLRMSSPNGPEKLLREAYGLWLNRVTYVESENANRLETLLWALREAEKAQDAVAVQNIMQFLATHYAVTEPPANALAARGFSIKSTRNYKAMDRDWRRAGWGLDEAYFASKPLVTHHAPEPDQDDFSSFRF